VPTVERTVLVGLAAVAIVWLAAVALCDPANGFLASAQDARSCHGLDPGQPYAGRPAWGSPCRWRRACPWRSCS
jgi:hypothetical protein